MARKILKGYRLYRLVLFIAFLGLVLLWSQMYYVQDLFSSSSDKESKDEELDQSQDERKNDDVIPFKELNRKADIPGLNSFKNDVNATKTFQEIEDKQIKELYTKTRRNQTFDHELKADVKRSSLDVHPVANISNLVLVRGVPAQLLRQYQVKDGKFTCINSKEVISAQSLNDDYCDCSDGTDEPGTSACPNSRFYCTYQLPDTDSPVHFPSSRVHDHVCDCCDGSDEEPRNKCENKCSMFEKVWQDKQKIAAEGAKIKKLKYMADAADTLYGVFKVLKGECFTKQSDKYTYKVCPFVDVRQADGKEEKVIGRRPHWLSKYKPWKLLMDDGDGQQCPGHTRRSTVLLFECGLHDKILSVQEQEVCEYLIVFSSPAAC